MRRNDRLRWPRPLACRRLSPPRGIQAARVGSTQSTRPQNECGSRLRPVSLLRVLQGRDKVRLAESRRRTEHADEVRAPEWGEIDGATPATPLGVAPIKIEAASTVVAAPTSDAVLAFNCLGTAG